MESSCISFSEIPRTTRLFLDFLYDFPRVAAFYEYDPFGKDVFLRAAEKIPNDRLIRSTVADVLTDQNRAYGAGLATEQNIERIRSGLAAAVVSGQQVGLFTGPLYSIYKCLTTIRLAQKLTTEGLSAVPVFWLAAEDHDLAEINHCFVLDQAHRLHRLHHSSSNSAAIQVGKIQLEKSITDLGRRLCSLHGNTPDAEALDLLVSTYEPGLSYAEAFARLLHKLLPGTGIVLLNPLDRRLRVLTVSLFKRALQDGESLGQRLLERNRMLERSGYHNQVHVRENSTLVFVNVDNTRQTVRRQRDKFHIAGRGLLGQEQLLGELEHQPEDFSANVLLRPLVQDMLLPTVAYVAGPAEIAYFAQASTLYAALLGRMPVIFPRASLTLLDRPVLRLLDRYGLQPKDIFQSHSRTFDRMARNRLPHGVQGRLARSEKNLEKLLDEIAATVAQTDRTLVGAAQTAGRKMFYQFRKLSTKAARAYAERQGLIGRHLAMLADSLYPRGALQERTLNIFSFLPQYGFDLLPLLSEQVRFPCRDHQFIYLDT